jgi:hypothetical protein
MQLSTHLVQVRTSLDMRQSWLRTRLGCLRCREYGGLGRATTSLLLRFLQTQSLDRLLNQSMRGNHFLYSHRRRRSLLRRNPPSEPTPTMVTPLTWRMTPSEMMGTPLMMGATETMGTMTTVKAATISSLMMTSIN